MNPHHEPLILEHVTLSLNGEVILSIHEHVLPGEVLTVMGSSGSGKSSLLAFIAGFLSPAFQASGRIFIGERDILKLAPEERRMGLLFQDPLLFPHLTVGGNIQFALPESIKNRAERRRLTETALASVDLAGFYDRHPDSLSGGQKARVALQRVLVSNPVALLLDEPFSKLDSQLREQTRNLVFDTAKEAGLPVLLVTHDEADAKAAGGKVIRIGSEAQI